MKSLYLVNDGECANMCQQLPDGIFELTFVYNKSHNAKVEEHVMKIIDFIRAIDPQNL
jgi:hypothetical protein